MSKFTESFDDVTPDEELKERVRSRIRAEQNAEQQPVYAAHGQAQKPPAPKKSRRFNFAPLAVAASFLFIVLVVPILVNLIGAAATNPRYDFSQARQVKSVNELKTALAVKERQPSGPIMPSILDLGSGGSFGKGATDDMESAPPPSPEAGPSAPTAPQDGSNSADKDDAGGGGSGSGEKGSSSSTNVQVAGMDEGDIIKNDDTYIYRLSGGGFTIAKADKGTLSEVCAVPFTNFSPIEMYIRGEGDGKQLILVGGGYRNAPSYGMNDMINGGYMNYYGYHQNVEIRIYNLSDIENPVLERFFEVDGHYLTSRIHDESGVMYFVVNYYNYEYYNYERKEDSAAGATADVARPYYRDEETAAAAPMPLDDIYYFKNNPAQSYMILGKVDLTDPASETEVKSYLSNSGIIYVSGENLYSATTQWFFDMNGNSSETKSYIAKFSLADLDYVGAGTVKGSPKDRYSLDEYEGNLRVASTYGTGSNSAGGVYVFDGNMKELAKILEIAKGEGIDSATFNGVKGYIATSPRPDFRFSDPLFTLDFTNPAKPTISEGLKEPGINQYLKAIKDTPFFLGFGIDSTESGSAKTGIKVQLYYEPDTASAPESKAKLTIEGANTFAEMLNNHKALLYMYDEETKTGYFGFAAERAGYIVKQVSYPATNWSNGYWADNYVYTVFEQGFYLYSFDVSDTANPTMTELGFLTNFAAGNVFQYDYSRNWNWQNEQVRFQQYVQRGVIIDGYIYTVADRVITAYDLDGLTQTSQLDNQTIDYVYGK